MPPHWMLGVANCLILVEALGKHFADDSWIWQVNIVTTILKRPVKHNDQIFFFPGGGGCLELSDLVRKLGLNKKCPSLNKKKIKERKNKMCLEFPDLVKILIRNDCLEMCS